MTLTKLMTKLIPTKRLRVMQPQAFYSWDPVQALFRFKLEQAQFQARRQPKQLSRRDPFSGRGCFQAHISANFRDAEHTRRGERAKFAGYSKSVCLHVHFLYRVSGMLRDGVSGTILHSSEGKKK